MPHEAAVRRHLALGAVLFALVVVVPTPPVGTTTHDAEATAAGRAFVNRYVDDDGRVVRHDQDGDTVSEGQAYGLLIAVALADRTTFDRIWRWTATNLQRGDGLLSWRWANGAVADPEPAADADLATASALALAAERFDDNDEYLAAARRIAAAILESETVAFDAERVLVAGPWARDGGIVNVGYFMFDAMARLSAATGDDGWLATAAGGRTLLAAVMATPPHLPPDWSQVALDGSVTPSAAPGGQSPRYGYESTRALVQLAVDCTTKGPSLAADAWPHFAGQLPSAIPAESGLDGRALGADRHPVALVAAAASAQAAGHHDVSARLLDEGTAIDNAYPTYYGAAWLALGRLWLDTSLLGGCRSDR